MRTYWNVLIVSGLVGGVAGGLSVLLFRTPTFNRQTFWGGATCEKCGCEVNRYGRASKTP
jgi:hypothetical protein